MAIFGPKPWVNPFAKMSIFEPFFTFYLFYLSCFYRLERRFLFQIIVKRHFPGLYCQKKKLEKWPILDQNYRVIPMEKSQFFDFQNFLFYRLKRRFFDVQYRKRHFPCLYCLKNKSWKNGHLQSKTDHGLTRLEKFQFFDFLNFFFLQP